MTLAGEGDVGNRGRPAFAKTSGVKKSGTLRAVFPERATRSARDEVIGTGGRGIIHVALQVTGVGKESRKGAGRRKTPTKGVED